MRLTRTTRIGLIAIVLLTATALRADSEKKTPYWFTTMDRVHAEFTGEPGTLALFGDSITVSQAFWTPLQYERKNLDDRGQRAYERVSGYMKKPCWGEWRGPEFGNEGGMTIRWAAENVDAWLKKLNPEVAVVMFGTNDLGQMEVEEYERTYRQVVTRILENGTIPILTTIPPRSGQLEKSRQFAEAVTRIAREMKVPLIDYFGETLRRRPDDWDGAAAKFADAAAKDVYDVPTIISGDGVHPSMPAKYRGDFSEEALSSSGFNLRSYLTLVAYAEVIGMALKPDGRIVK